MLRNVASAASRLPETCAACALRSRVNGSRPSSRSASLAARRAAIGSPAPTATMPRDTAWKPRARRRARGVTPEARQVGQGEESGPKKRKKEGCADGEDQGYRHRVLNPIAGIRDQNLAGPVGEPDRAIGGQREEADKDESAPHIVLPSSAGRGVERGQGPIGDFLHSL